MSAEIETTDDNAASRADKIISRASLVGLFSSNEAKVVAGNFIKTHGGAYDGDWHLVKYVYLEGSDNVVNQKMMSCIGIGKSYEYPISMRKASIVREHESALHKFHGNRTVIWVDDLGNVFTTRPELGLEDDKPIKNVYVKTRYLLDNGSFTVNDLPFSPVGFDWHIMGKAEKAYIIGSLPYKGSLLNELNAEFDAVMKLREKAMKGLFKPNEVESFEFIAEDECDTSLVGEERYFFELNTLLFSQ
tara:strand:- start:64422 stop:65159 length:738 start_codon:yes stop_codon:yes gene_type:complete